MRRRCSTATTSPCAPPTRSSTRASRPSCSASCARTRAPGAPGRRGRRRSWPRWRPGPRRPRAAFAQHCEVAERLAGRLGVGDDAAHALGFVFERWDGKGFPAGARGEAIPLAARLLHVARDADALCAHAGEDARRGRGGRPRGRRLRPRPGGAAVRRRRAGSRATWARRRCGTRSMARRAGGAGLHGERARRGLRRRRRLRRPQVAVDARALARRRRARRGGGVARWVWRSDEVDAVRRAALLHDLGRVGVSNAIWDKPGAARPRPSGSACACTRTTPSARWRGRPCWRGWAQLAGAHHERLDGSGYHRGAAAPSAAPSARAARGRRRLPAR